jgi:pyruvate/2-oxoglutarate dehydrogenase complex dihydrolipoamide acyltransferase (E2) component
MSNFEFKLPDIGEGVTEGEIVNWLVQAGDSVSENQEMVEVMTDKATVTIGAPKTGKVSELRFKVGDTVPVGEVLIVLDIGGEGAPKAEAPQAEAAKAKPESARAAPSAPAASAVGDIREHLPGMPAPEASVAPRNGNSEYFTDKPLAAPATRKLARELGVDLRRVEPSGSAGRVTREDVEQFASGSRTAAPVAARHEVRPPAPPPRIAPPAQRQEDERVPIRGLRKRIYENMARSKHTAAHFHYVDEVDVTELRALRERTAPIVERTGAKLNFLPIIIKAVVAALRKHPRLNSVVDDSALELVVRKTYDIGIAVATENGLIVPVLRNADRLSIVDMAHEIERLATAAREGKSQQADLGGSTFTVTSLGKLGGLIAPPIINYPEVGIMGIHAMKKRPVVRGDQIVIGEVMHLSFSFDHRVIDGDVGANFAQEIIGFLQEPDRLFVEMA